MNHLECRGCLKILPIEKFSKKNDSLRGYSYKCKDCHNKYCREVWYKKNKDKHVKANRKYKEKHRAKILSKRYNLPIKFIEDEIKKCDNKCKICSKEGNLQLDHCHKTGVFRGFICRECNLILGRLGDNLEKIMRYVNYLSGKL